MFSDLPQSPPTPLGNAGPVSGSSRAQQPRSGVFLPPRPRLRSSRPASPLSAASDLDFRPGVWWEGGSRSQCVGFCVVLFFFFSFLSFCVQAQPHPVTHMI